ncbi:MAG: UDP-glucose:(heptosyl)LPS alpha,3-glucosyltransferase [Solirubrobacteraceae bacterium]|nr:UDP-glucose:(heptosyl)LPS alpha,3-glucosyltransferase [Solirubrobacteraceae bacterium]
MRIALSNPDVDLSGGVERVVVATANQLHRFGHDVTVYAARADSRVLDEGVRIQRVAVPAGLDRRTGLGFRRRCGRLIRADQPDVHGAFSTLSPVGGVFWVPSVHRVGYEFLLSSRDRASQWAMRLNPYHIVRLRLERTMFSAHSGGRALAQTPTVKADILRAYPTAARSAIGVLALGYDDRVFNPARREALRTQARVGFGFSERDQVLLFAANELERKGFDVLLAAIAKLPHGRVLGAGRVAPSVRLLRESGIGDRVHWAGHVSDMTHLYAAADALVLPTRYEPWGLVIVEALGSGLPVVTSRLAGAAEAVREGETGLLLDDPRDPEELVAALRWVCSRSARPAAQVSDSVADYTWERVIRRYEAVLVEVAAQP